MNKNVPVVYLHFPSTVASPQWQDNIRSVCVDVALAGAVPVCYVGTMSDLRSRIFGRSRAGGLWQFVFGPPGQAAGIDLGHWAESTQALFRVADAVLVLTSGPAWAIALNLGPENPVVQLAKKFGKPVLHSIDQVGEYAKKFYEEERWPND
jgi:hypothetical protein